MRIVERLCRICGAAVAREYTSDGTYLGISHDEARGAATITSPTASPHWKSSTDTPSDASGVCEILPTCINSRTSASSCCPKPAKRRVFCFSRLPSRRADAHRPSPGPRSSRVDSPRPHASIPCRDGHPRGGGRHADRTPLHTHSLGGHRRWMATGATRGRSAARSGVARRGGLRRHRPRDDRARVALNGGAETLGAPTGPRATAPQGAQRPPADTRRRVTLLVVRTTDVPRPETQLGLQPRQPRPR